MKINLGKNKKYPEVGDVFKFNNLGDFYLLVQNEWNESISAVCLRTGIGEFTWDNYEEFLADENDFITSVISSENIEIRLIEN